MRGLHEPTDACTGHCSLVRVAVLYDHASGEALPWVMSRASYERLMPKEPEPVPEKVDYVCAECGAENESMPCSACGSVRIVLLSTIVDLFGENWRDNLPEKPA